ncbi:MAG: bifunctional 4-hydroxy-2-oxoglutarate aldolase/2-dehydro-3-deoxy-phosphogluconate aldolase [Leptolyngbyaceae cyanobacterium SL_5_9]|nr:bifunctional 4-hydroxy-2-oxoglutarate aldolase/2-dehydro-3-deoxy-phosphogluconate aldolase [Leptolyngbyaceae cyanobacterium SL_5_9]NJO73726.1 bifunctional 4-hydroxy-2-oxoglutarate aldolase/2-dehydro-3-deoxy-phosphogluconate aldolase [Leptolyngbyaceae cyanobacterium RM1_406_9]
MLRSSWQSLVRQQRAIAVIRASHFDLGMYMARAIAAADLRLIEITWNSDRAGELIQRLRSELPDCVIGTGTLLTLDQLKDAIAAGAEFLFTPHVNSALIEMAVAQQVPVIPGAFSPTEIVTAWQAGAACVKVFPVQALGGVEYIRSLQGPLGDIPLIPTGGVTVQNARSFLDAGAIAVGLSGQLFPQEAIATQNWELITQQAKILRHNLTSCVSDRPESPEC